MSEHWYESRQNDRWAIDVYVRHYSAGKNRAAFNSLLHSGFVGPGEKIVLLTENADALFVWRKEEFGYDKQSGINNSVFRNEGAVLSSVLIAEAVAIAWEKWPGERLFTFVNGGAVRRKRDVGRCFIRAGWSLCGTSKEGLLIFELVPSAGTGEKK
jgi:hypothetical protein